MTPTLTDRYLYAATRSVPEKNRADLAAELEASITDAIDARVDAGEPRDAAERAVLTEMGDPDRLAADYTDRPSFLIGPRYYFEWLRLVKILFAIVLPLAVLGVGLGQLLSGAGVGALIGTLVVSIITISLHLVFWPTLVFALLERNPGSSRLETTRAAAGPWAQWSLDRLPDIRPQGLGTADLVASLTYVALLAAALLWDQFVGFVFIDGQGVPLIDPALWSFWIPVILAALVGEVIFAIVLFRTGRWTPWLAVINAVLALVFAVPLIWLLAQGMLFNPAFFDATSGAYAGEVAQVVGITVGCTVGAIALWDIVDGILKTVRVPRTVRRS